MKRIVAALVLCLCCLFITGAGVPDSLDTGQVDIVNQIDSRWPVADINCRLYHVADLSGVFVNDFAGYRFNIIDINTSDAIVLANTLESIAIRDNILADYVGRTNTSGQVSFVGLQPGIYLLTSDDFDMRDVIYHAQPSLFAIYAGDIIKLEIKHVVEPIRPDHPDTPTTIQKVLKKWDDDDNPDRPRRVKVELLRNGRVYDSVYLSAKNNWRYTWTDLDRYAKWSVVECDIDGDYTCDITQSGVTTILTNVLTPDKPVPPEKPEKPEKPGEPEKPETPVPEDPGDPNKPDVPTDTPTDTPTDIPNDDTPTGTKIPQTGYSQYLVPVLSLIGLSLIGIGLVIRRRGSHGA